MVEYSAGIVTAYGSAKRAGYTGSYEDFCRQQAQYAQNASAVEQAKQTAVSSAQVADRAKQDAQTASTQAQSASQSAQGSAQSAGQSAQDAQTAKNNAQTYAQSASQSAGSAQQSAQTAQDVLESIPKNYSDLSKNVDQLKADLCAMNTASSSDVGKALKAKTVINGKVTEWEFGESGQPTDAQVEEAVNEYLSLHPVSALDASNALYGQIPTADGNGHWSWDNSNANTISIDVSQFGGYSDGTHAAETENAINDALTWAKSHGYDKIVLPDGEYLIRGYNPSAPESQSERNAGIVPPSNLDICLSANAVIKVEANGKKRYGAFYIYKKENIRISGGKIVGDRFDHDYTTVTSTHEWGCGIRAIGSDNIIIENVKFCDFTGDCITFGSDGTYGEESYAPEINSAIKHCELYNSRRQGITLSGVSNIYVSNNLIHDIGTTIDGNEGIAPKTGIDIEGYGTFEAAKSQPIEVFIIGNTFRDNYSDDINMFTAYKALVVGNIFSGSVACSYATQSIVSNNVFSGRGTKTAMSVTYSRQIFNNVNGLTISGNVISNYETGLRLAGNYVKASDNFIIGCVTGINLYGTGSGATNIEITSNRIIKCTTGMQLNFASQVYVKNNILEETTTPLKWGIALTGDIVVDSNVFDTFSDELLDLRVRSDSDNKLMFSNNVVKNVSYSAGPLIYIPTDFSLDLIGNKFLNITARNIVNVQSNNSHAEGVIGVLNMVGNVIKGCSSNPIVRLYDTTNLELVRIINNVFYANSSNTNVIKSHATQLLTSLISGNTIMPENSGVTITKAIDTSAGFGSIIRNIAMIGAITTHADDISVDNYETA